MSSLICKMADPKEDLKGHMPCELRKIISSTAYGIAFICFVYSCASSIIINGNSLRYEHPHGTAISAKVTHLTSSWS